MKPPNKRSAEALALHRFKPKVIQDKRKKPVKHKKKDVDGLSCVW